MDVPDSIMLAAVQDTASKIVRVCIAWQPEPATDWSSIQADCDKK